MEPVRCLRIFLLEDFHIFRLILFKMMKDCAGARGSLVFMTRMLVLKIPQKQVILVVDGVLFLPLWDMGMVIGSIYKVHS